MAHAAGVGAGDLDRLAQRPAGVAHRDGDARVLARAVHAPGDAERAVARGVDDRAGHAGGSPGSRVARRPGAAGRALEQARAAVRAGRERGRRARGVGVGRHAHAVRAGRELYGRAEARLARAARARRRRARDSEDSCPGHLRHNVRQVARLRRAAAASAGAGEGGGGARSEGRPDPAEGRPDREDAAPCASSALKTTSGPPAIAEAIGALRNPDTASGTRWRPTWRIWARGGWRPWTRPASTCRSSATPRRACSTSTPRPRSPSRARPTTRSRAPSPSIPTASPASRRSRRLRPAPPPTSSSARSPSSA